MNLKKDYSPASDIFALQPGKGLAVDYFTVMGMFEDNHRPMTTAASQLQDWLDFLRIEHNITYWVDLKEYKYYFIKLETD